MALTLSDEQRDALKRGESPLYLLNPDDGAWYVLLPAGGQVHAGGEETEIRDYYALQERVAQAEGWDDPIMDEYNDYDAYRRST